MNILHNPSETLLRLDLSEGRSDRQSRGDSADGLVEEAGVAGPEAPHEIVHRQFEGLRIGYRNNPFALAFCVLRPAGTVERRVEVAAKNRALRFIEDFGALFPAELFGSVDKFFSCHLQSP